MSDKSDKSDFHRDYVLELEGELRELEEREQSSTRRMQMLVYPSLVAFVILASYGFYLVQSLTSNVSHMAKSIVVISDSIHTNMTLISQSTVQMSGNMSTLVSSTQSMTSQMGELVSSTAGMKNDVGLMTSSIHDMNTSTLSMAESTSYMGRDMRSLNHNISTPLSMFNKFLPWSNNSIGRYPGSPPVRQQKKPVVQPQPTYTQPPVYQSPQTQQPTYYQPQVPVMSAR